MDGTFPVLPIRLSFCFGNGCWIWCLRWRAHPNIGEMYSPLARAFVDGAKWSLTFLFWCYNGGWTIVDGNSSGCIGSRHMGAGDLCHIREGIRSVVAWSTACPHAVLGRLLCIRSGRAIA